MHIGEPSVLGFVLDKLNASFIPHLSSLNVKVLNRLFTPPSRRHLVLSEVYMLIEAKCKIDQHTRLGMYHEGSYDPMVW